MDNVMADFGNDAAAGTKHLLAERAFRTKLLAVIMKVKAWRRNTHLVQIIIFWLLVKGFILKIIIVENIVS
jgi:hypothetical protein